MGMINPKTGRYEPITRIITRDGLPARNASDVIAYQLGDGTQVTFEENQEYETKRREVIKAHRVKIIALENEHRAALGALYKNWVETAQGAK